MQRVNQSFFTTPICQLDPELSLLGKARLRHHCYFSCWCCSVADAERACFETQEISGEKRHSYKLLLSFCTSHRRPTSSSSTAWAGALHQSGTAGQSRDVLALPTRTALPAPSLLTLAQAHPVWGGFKHTGNALPAITSSGEQGLRHPDGSVGVWFGANILSDRQCLKRFLFSRSRQRYLSNYC